MRVPDSDLPSPAPSPTPPPSALPAKPVARPTPAPKTASGRVPDSDLPSAVPAPRPVTLPSHISTATQRADKLKVDAAVDRFTNAIQRPGQTGEALFTRGPNAMWNTLVHGETSAQYQADTHTMGKVLAENVFGDNMTEAQYNALPPWVHNLFEIGAQTGTDPLTYIGGSGLARAGVANVTEHALPIVMQVGKAAAKHPGTVRDVVGAVGEGLTRLHNAVTPGGESAAHAARTLALGREEALSAKAAKNIAKLPKKLQPAATAATQFYRNVGSGAQGMRTYQQLYALRGAGLTQAALVAHGLQTAFDKSIHGLTDEEQLAVFRAIHNGTIAKLPEHLQDAANKVVQVDRSIAHLNGSAALRARLANKHGFTLPEELKTHDVATPRGVVRVSNFRTNHIPLPHELDPDDAQSLLERIETGARPETDTTSTVNPQFKPRVPTDPDSPGYPLEDAGLIRDLFSSSFRRAGRQTAAADLQRELARRFAPPVTVRARMAPGSEAKMAALKHANDTRIRTEAISPEDFDQLRPSVQNAMTSAFAPTRDVRTVQRFADVPEEIRNFFVKPERAVSDKYKSVAKVAKSLRSLSDVSRSTMFTTPFPHQTRIWSLLALHGLTDPSTLPKAIANYARLHAGFASPEQEAKVLGFVRKAGGTGVPNIEQSRLVSSLSKMRVPEAVAKKYPWTRSLEIAPKIAAKWYGGVGKALWSWDDAAKAALFEQNLRHYGDPLRAAYHTQQSLVDYGVSSPLTENARVVSSFPTWRTRLPVAVLKGLAENPHNAALLARLAQRLGIGAAAAFGGTFEFGGKERKANSSGIAEGVQSFTDPQAYLRGTLSPTGKLAMELGSAVVHRGRPDMWWTYGQNPASFIGHSLPIANQAAPLMGAGMFRSSPGDEALYNLTGISTVEPTANDPYSKAIRSIKTENTRRLHQLDSASSQIDHATGMTDAQKAAAQQQIFQKRALLTTQLQQQLSAIEAARKAAQKGARP